MLSSFETVTVTVSLLALHGKVKNKIVIILTDIHGNDHFSI